MSKKDYILLYGERTLLNEDHEETVSEFRVIDLTAPIAKSLLCHYLPSKEDAEEVFKRLGLEIKQEQTIPEDVYKRLVSELEKITPPKRKSVIRYEGRRF